MFINNYEEYFLKIIYNIIEDENIKEMEINTFKKFYSDLKFKDYLIKQYNGIYRDIINLSKFKKNTLIVKYDKYDLRKLNYYFARCDNFMHYIKSLFDLKNIEESEKKIKKAFKKVNYNKLIEKDFLYNFKNNTGYFAIFWDNKTKFDYKTLQFNKNYLNVEISKYRSLLELNIKFESKPTIYKNHVKFTNKNDIELFKYYINQKKIILNYDEIGKLFNINNKNYNSKKTYEAYGNKEFIKTKFENIINAMDL